MIAQLTGGNNALVPPNDVNSLLRMIAWNLVNGGGGNPDSLIVDPATGAITGPVTSDQFKSGNSIGNLTVNATTGAIESPVSADTFASGNGLAPLSGNNSWTGGNVFETSVGPSTFQVNGVASTLRVDGTLSLNDSFLRNDGAGLDLTLGVLQDPSTVYKFDFLNGDLYCRSAVMDSFTSDAGSISTDGFGGFYSAAVTTGGLNCNSINQAPVVSDLTFDGQTKLLGNDAANGIIDGYSAIFPISMGEAEDGLYLVPTQVGVASGTSYTLTASSAKVDFGTTDPSTSLGSPGTWLLSATIQLNYNGATFAANQTVSITIRRTNNTASDLVTLTYPLQLVTALTQSGPVASIVNFPYTASSGDTIEIWANLSALPGAGTVTVTKAWIVAQPVG